MCRVSYRRSSFQRTDWPRIGDKGELASRLLACYPTQPRSGELVTDLQRPCRDALPPGWTLLFFPATLARTSQLAPSDATEEIPFHPPPSASLERMWVGGSFTFPKDAAPLQIGQEITSEASVDSVKERVGKDGRTGYYVDARRDIRPLGATKPSVIEMRTHLYRPALSSPPAGAGAAASPTKPRRAAGEDDCRADFAFPFLPTPPHLLRFSALTFNTHRIHWDEAYCRDVEHREGESLFDLGAERIAR